MTRRLLAAILFASLAWTTAPALVRITREAIALRKLPLRDRRARVTSGFSRATHDVLASTPASERLALVPRYDHPGESDAAVFFNYYAYPRATRTWPGLQAYALDRDPHRPKTIVGFGGGPHRTNYAGLREESMRGPNVISDLRPSLVARRELIVPFVASVDGPPPDTYTVEALLVADSRANVDITLYPSGVTRRFVVEGARTFRDLGYDVGGELGIGWARVRSDVPLRTAFHFVNRGRAHSTPIAIVSDPPPLPLHFPARPSARLWIANFGDDEVIAMAGGVGARVPPHGLIQMGPEVIVTAPKPLFAFLSEKKADGSTEFIWPDGWAQ
jgi:hypothetical protein